MLFIRIFLVSLICHSVVGLKLTFKKIFTSAVVSTISIMAPNNAAMAELIPTPWDNNVKYEVIQASPKDTPAVKVGDLVAIRFRGDYKGQVFDDTYKTDQPYFYRCGVGSLVKGLDDAVTHMKVGDHWKLEFGGDLAFGQKGKPSSPGKARIPPNAALNMEVTLEALPGTGDDLIADYEESADEE